MATARVDLKIVPGDNQKHVAISKALSEGGWVVDCTCTTCVMATVMLGDKSTSSKDIEERVAYCISNTSAGVWRVVGYVEMTFSTEVRDEHTKNRGGWLGFIMQENGWACVRRDEGSGKLLFHRTSADASVPGWEEIPESM